MTHETENLASLQQAYFLCECGISELVPLTTDQMKAGSTPATHKTFWNLGRTVMQQIANLYNLRVERVRLTQVPLLVAFWQPFLLISNYG